MLKPLIGGLRYRGSPTGLWVNYFMAWVAYSHSRDTWNWLWFSRGGVHWVKCLIAIFQGISASIGEIFAVAGGLGDGVSFYGF